MIFLKGYCSFLWLYLIIVTCLALQCYADANQTSTLVVDASNNASGRPIPHTLFGIFFEEINHAGAGGLWAELVNNKGFEAGGTQVPSNIEPWTIVGKESDIVIQTVLGSCFERNNVALQMDVLCDNCPSDGVGISNPGFWGMNIVHGKKYKVVFFVSSTGPLDITVSFRKAEDGGVLASSYIKGSASKWTRMETTLVASASSSNSTLYLTTTKKGVILLDQVSAMPVDTFKGHGFRSDLTQMLVELKPAFLRFPGGCFIEGQTLKNAFRWKESVGPWEQRPGHFGDVWSYWTDDGFGYFEGLQLAEDIGARPLWVFNNGISHTDEIDTSMITPFVQEALDGIEFARGATTSKWGSLRASMGHPQPFDLKYVAIGNEDCGKQNYRGNYLMFYHAIRRAYPDIQIISNCDASAKPLDHPADIYDYHTYPTEAQIMFNDAHVFDKTPRNGPKAFVSEYALTGDKEAKLGTLLGAISEAGFLIGLEGNSDHVIMASYAPLFVNANDRKWNPDAIVFNSNQVYGTPSYWVQYLFRESSGATLLKSQLQTPAPYSTAASAIFWQNPQDKKTYLKIKVANLANNQVNLKISLNGFASSDLTKSTKTMLTSANALDENSFTDPEKIIPKQGPLENPGNQMNVILPPVSLTVIDLLK
ncbi:alpha-L-arabinofuranosidase 1-like [Abrus precatorius]|uniref:non-reducing end alpha-L-arabinofuranosidase n=1 Tax=Abrus precatorius TaxID=3816 RepID=A0A8B8L495_ABRPR|nr:alpha-L-arabinofuranosidase 1-like [Abrus precatorius]